MHKPHEGRKEHVHFLRQEQVDLDDIYEHEVRTTAMRTMVIGNVRPHDQQMQDQPSSSTMVQPPTQDEE
jgi:hypothetical protein